MQTVAIEYFQFEEDFMEDNIRCIPMIVRFKLDQCGIKLRLKEWSNMNVEEHIELAVLPTNTPENIDRYKKSLCQLIFHYTGNQATMIPIEMNPGWSIIDHIPPSVQEKTDELNTTITLQQWQRLNALQRFALVKLSQPSHENKNLPKALKEFGIHSTKTDQHIKAL
ncbi:MAG: nitrate reductase associated protein [Cyclobacteriaceae bacterium]|nr:nitrate reductase associated protein [Cyclobacteriaceae bacterium]